MSHHACANMPSSISYTLLGIRCDVSQSRSIHFVIKFLKFFASCQARDHVLFNYRLNKVRPTIDDSNVTANIASHGFIVYDDSESMGAQSLSIICVSCHSIVNSPLPADLRSFHCDGCCYKELQEFCVGKCDVVSNHSELIDYLINEMKSTKVLVVEELGFSQDVICTVLSDKFLQNNSKFHNAGQLTEAVMDFQEELVDLNIEPEALCGGFADWIKSHRKKSTRRSSKYAVQPGDSEKSDRFEDLVNETMSLVHRTNCKVCLSSKIEYLVLDCGHLAFCAACSTKASMCPICGSHVYELVRVYLP